MISSAIWTRRSFAVEAFTATLPWKECAFGCFVNKLDGTFRQRDDSNYGDDVDRFDADQAASVGDLLEVHFSFGGWEGLPGIRPEIFRAGSS